MPTLPAKGNVGEVRSYSSSSLKTAEITAVPKLRMKP